MRANLDIGFGVITPGGMWITPQATDTSLVALDGEYVIITLRSLPLREEGIHRFEVGLGNGAAAAVEIPAGSLSRQANLRTFTSEGKEGHVASGSKVPNDGWIDRALNISGRPVTVSVRLLSEAERQAVAGEIAWLASAGAADGQALEHTVWCTLVNDVVARHVAFTVDESTGEELNSAWWGQAVEQATAALISVNHLEEAIRRLLARNFTPGKVNRMAS